MKPPATLAMSAAELANADIERGLALHMEKTKHNGCSPEGVIRCGHLFLTAVGIRVDGAVARREWEGAVERLEGLGAEGKAVALNARMEVLKDAVEQAQIGSKREPVLEGLNEAVADVLGEAG